MKHKGFFIFFILFSLSMIAKAQTINAASCNQSDVQAAFNKVTASTTSVTIPAGTCGWSSGASLTVPSGNAGLTIQGQTVCTGQGNPTVNNLSCADKTVIEDQMSYSSADPPLLAVTTLAGAPFRITGLTFTGTGSNQTYNGAINIYGASQSVRFDHNHLSNINALSLNAGAGIAGVFDHNILAQSNPQILFHVNQATGSDWGGNLTWSQPTNLGSSNFVFFEDNLIVGGSSDCDRGGRFVLRYNTFRAASGTAQFLLVHPTGEPGGAIRGCRAWEAYGNAFTVPSGVSNVFSIWFLSAGTGVTWGNSVTPNTVSNFFTLISMRRTNRTYSQTATPNGWGYCGGTQSGTGSPWDENSNSTTGYRCLDQPGTGQADLLTLGGGFPTLVDTKTGNISWPHQASEPIYEWMDTFTPEYGSFVNNENSDALINNSDYYVWCNSASPSGCTSFNGTEGVGSGTLAARPATCTTGVGYFAMDQGTWNTSKIGGQGELFKCTSTNTWTLAYTPYSYPHPLVSGTTANATANGAPTGLTGNVVH